MHKFIYIFLFAASAFNLSAQIDPSHIVDKYWAISLKETYKPITPDNDWRKCAFDFDKMNWDKRSTADKTIQAPYHGGMIFRKNNTFEEVTPKALNSERKANTGTWKLSHDTITVTLSDKAMWYFVILKSGNSSLTLKHWWESNDPVELQETQE